MRGAWRLPALLVLLVVGAGGSPTPEDDLGPPLGVAWTHAMGGPAASERTRPRVPCVDDGPVAGAPIGGMGAGTMGRTYRGDFARWHMRVGGHTHRPAAHTLFAARVDGTATVLSALPSHAVMESVPGGGGSDRTHSRRVLPPDGTGGTYHALYPRSWYEYDPSALAPGGRVRLSQTQFSPVIPGEYRDASMPVGVFRFLASNEGDAPADVALAFSFENVLATTDVAPVDVGPPRDAWRLAPDALTHATFERAGGRVAGCHMHTDDVVYGTRAPSEPWHGGLAVAVDIGGGADKGGGEGGLNVTVLPLYDVGDADTIRSKFWRPFERAGGFGRDDAAAANEHDGGIAAGPLSACAVSAAFTLAPGERRNVTFAAAWDLPASSFPRGVRWAKRYTRYHGSFIHRRDVPRGAAAPDIATEALLRADEWEGDIARWQRGFVQSAAAKDANLDDPAGGRGRNYPGRVRDRPTLRRPAWLVSALFNELYYLVDGGTLWGRPLTVAGLEGDVEESEASTAAPGGWRGEDGEGGDAQDVAGNGGEWGGTLGRFGLLESFDAPVYNALDVHFYGSWPLAMLWPGLDLAVLADLAAGVDSEDDEERALSWNARDAGRAPEMRKRKVRGSAPRDLGAPFDAPLTSSPNAFDLTDVNRWKDLAPKLMLTLARAHALRGGFRGPNDPGGIPRDVLRRMFRPCYESLAAQLRRFDGNGDGLIEHDDDDDEAGPDHSFVAWRARGDTSAYAGGLWLAALRAGAGLARDLNETDARDSLEQTMRAAAVAHDAALWLGDDDGGRGYYRFDASGTEGGDVSSAAQVMGEWALAVIGARGVLPARKVRAALASVARLNVAAAGGAGGAVNGAAASGSVDAVSAHSNEVWPGVSYAVASHMLLAGMDDEAWELARGVAAGTYERGLAFRTPEAWDARGGFRSAMSQRAGSVWAIEHALTLRHRREVAAWEKAGRGRVKDEL